MEPHRRQRLSGGPNSGSINRVRDKSLFIRRLGRLIVDTDIAARDCRLPRRFRNRIPEPNGLGPRIVRNQASQDEYHGLYEKKIWGATRKTISKSREAPQLTFRVIRGLILLSVESVLFVLACHGSTTQVRSAECSCRPGAAVHDSASASRGTCRPSPAETPTKSAITSVPVTIRVGLLGFSIRLS